MDAPLDLIVGIGNPGAEYAETRHNAGVWFVERVAASYGGVFKADKKFFGKVASISVSGREVRLLVPDTFMNQSGRSVAALVNYYKIPANQCLIAHDELDFAIGTVRLKQGGGLAGHNGLRDIASSLGGNQDFCRLRIGVGHPGDKGQVTGHVLGRVGKRERNIINDCIEEAIRVLPAAVSGDWPSAMQALHSLKFDLDGDD